MKKYELIAEKQAELIEILKRMIHVSGLLYPPSKVIKDINRQEELESELSLLESQEVEGVSILNRL